MKLERAVAYLKNVIAKKEIVPFRRFTGGPGKHSQMKNLKATNGRWPQKSAKVILGLLQNAQASAELKELDTEKLFVKRIAVQQAPKTRRRTFRAHGRINAYMCSPCHVEVHLSEGHAVVPKPSSSALARK